MGRPRYGKQFNPLRTRYDYNTVELRRRVQEIAAASNEKPAPAAKAGENENEEVK